MKSKFALVIILLSTVLLNIHWVSERLIDWDEGFHLYSANQISEGQQIYTDFFYVQLPLFPYLLIPLSSPGFSSLFIWRSVAAGIGFLLGLLILWYAVGLSNLKTGIFVFFLYALNGTILAWHTVVHPGGFAQFFTFFSFILLIYGIKKRNNSLLFASGLTLSLGVLLRIIYLPVIGLWIYLICRERSYTPLVYLLAGFVLIILFPLYFFARNTERFIFETYTFHLIRGKIWTNLTGLGQIWTQKGVALGKFFILPQTLIISGFSILALVYYLTSKRSSYTKELTLMGVAFIVFVGHLFLVPVHFYYFVQSLPFLIAAQIPYLDGWLRRNSYKVISLILVVYGIGMIIPYAIYVSGVRERDRGKKIDNFRETVEAIESLSDQDDQIVSINPTYLYLSNRKGLGLQPWLLEISGGFNEEQKRIYKIPDSERMKLYIETKRPKLVVGDPGWDPPYYKKITFPWVVIWVREDQ